MSWGDLAVVAGLTVLWAAVSGRAERLGITAAMVFTLAGLALGGERALHITLTASAIRGGAEFTLVMVLFADAARVRLPSLRHDLGLPTRLLAIGLPLTVLLGAGAAAVLFGSLGGWMVVLIGACLAPTDAGLGAGIVTDSSVPSRIRRALNVESGLNDGIVAPLVSLAVAALVGESSHITASVAEAAREIGLGAAVGVGGGIVAGWVLSLAVRRGWAAAGTAAVATTAAAIGVYALALAVDGNGFVAAFAAGLCFGAFRQEVGAQALELTEGAGQLLACLVWFAFGAAMLRPALSSPALGRAVVYAVISLTIVRMVPVALALYRTHLGATSLAFIGWFGPRGLASVIFALLADDKLGNEAATLVTIVSVTVAVSVVAHGLSANPLIARYAKHAGSRASDHPLRTEVEVPPARRSFGVLAPPAGRPAG